MSTQTETAKRTVQEANYLIRNLVNHKTTGSPFWTTGYVTDYSLSTMGDAYFELVDQEMSIDCVVREDVRVMLGFPISDGADIEVYGAIRTDEKTSKVVIEVQKARPHEHFQRQMTNATLGSEGMNPWLQYTILAVVLLAALILAVMFVVNQPT